MTTHSFRQRLLRGKYLIGTWMQINNATAAEVLANSGHDWIAIDIEHTDIDITSLTALLRSMYGRGAAPIVRIACNETINIRRALDAGAAGVLVPFVNTADEARQAVAAAKYPPIGVRGFSFTRANDWGASFQADVQTANDETAVILMIESKQGVEHIDEIVAVEGVDAIFIGPFDLSGSYGMPGQTQHPIVREACLRVVEACQAVDKSVGLLVGYPTSENVCQAVDEGFTLLALGVDTVFLDQAARAAKAVAVALLAEKGLDR